MSPIRERYGEALLFRPRATVGVGSSANRIKDKYLSRRHCLTRALQRWRAARQPGRRCLLVACAAAALAEHVFCSQKLFADGAPIPVLDPGGGRTKEVCFERLIQP